MNKINREYLNEITKIKIDFEKKLIKYQPLFDDFESKPNSLLITNKIRLDRNLFFDDLNEYHYKSNNWINGELLNTPLSNLVRIEFNSLYPKLILAFYDIKLFQLINKEDIDRLRNFYENRNDLKKDVEIYTLEKTWVNNLLVRQNAYHDFKFVIDSYMYGLVFNILTKSKGSVVLYNVDELVLINNNPNFDYKEYLDPYFDYDVTCFDRGYFTSIRDYALISEEDIISVGDKSLVNFIKNSDMVTGKDRIISSLISGGFIDDDNINIANKLAFNSDVLSYYFTKNPNGINNKNVVIDKDIIKFNISCYSEMLYRMGVRSDEQWKLVIDKLSDHMNSIKLDSDTITKIEMNLLSKAPQSFTITLDKVYVEYLVGYFNFIEFVDKIIK